MAQFCGRWVKRPTPISIFNLSCDHAVKSCRMRSRQRRRIHDFTSRVHNIQIATHSRELQFNFKKCKMKALK